MAPSPPDTGPPADAEDQDQEQDHSSEHRDQTTDSLNSLIAESNPDTTDCAGVECSLASQCGMTCEDRNTKMEDYYDSSICCNPTAQIVWGVLLIAMSISGFLLTPVDFMLREKLNMRPGFPPYEWWADPPDEVKLRVYVFNVTNHERFLSGADAKIKVQEVGPIVYLEKLLHYNMYFNENGTMTYTAKRFPVYLPDENSLNLNDTIIVPNLAVLGIASFLHDANFIVTSGFRLLVNSHGSQLFVKRTLHQYLWDFRDPVLETSQSLAPGLVPVTNMGMLDRVYADFTDELTVKVGPTWGHREFFTIDNFRGQPQLPGYDPDICPDRIYGSTEGVMYHQYLSKKDTLLYWRKTVCKLMPLIFHKEAVVDNVPVYRYNLSEFVFERITNGTDCYDTNPSLPAGLSDASKCYFDFPMVVSYPHFYTGSPPRDRYVLGLTPDRSKHNSYVMVEPQTGIPFRSVARMQSNLRIHDLTSFSGDYAKFSNLVLPLFWAEYNQEGLPGRIRLTLFFMIVVLPPLSKVILILTLLFGCYLIAKQIYITKFRNESFDSFLHFRSKNMNTLAKNKMFTYEKEGFLKVPS